MDLVQKSQSKTFPEKEKIYQAWGQHHGIETGEKRHEKEERNEELRLRVAPEESKNIKSATNRINQILYAKYEKANLKDITTKLKYLNSDKQFLI